MTLVSVSKDLQSVPTKSSHSDVLFQKKKADQVDVDIVAKERKEEKEKENNVPDNCNSNTSAPLKKHRKKRSEKSVSSLIKNVEKEEKKYYPCRKLDQDNAKSKKKGFVEEESKLNVRSNSKLNASRLDLLALRECTKSLERFLDEAYCSFSHQVGYRTDGHQCIGMRDREEAFQAGSSLLYGEVLPLGVASMLDTRHLDAPHCHSLFDLGMGTGKLALQAFLQYPTLRRVVGIELAFSRYRIGEKALLNIVTRYSGQFVLLHWNKGQQICIASAKDNRTLEFRRGDLLETQDMMSADIVIVQTDFPDHTYPQLLRFLHAGMKCGTNLLTYLNLEKLWNNAAMKFPFVEFAEQSRFATSWSTKVGHLFHLWRKELPPPTHEEWLRFDKIVKERKMQNHGRMKRGKGRRGGGMKKRYSNSNRASGNRKGKESRSANHRSEKSERKSNFKYKIASFFGFKLK
eukprot:g3955.t1